MSTGKDKCEIKRKMGLRYALPRMILASLCFAFMGVFVKLSVESLPFLVAVFFRTFIGLLMLIFYMKCKGLSFQATQHRLLLIRSICGFLALTFFFFALEKLPLSTATVLNFSSPIFVVILSGFFLQEKKIGIFLPLVVSAFGGAVLLVAPDLSSLNLAALLGLLSALFAALAMIAVKRLSKTESSTTIVYYFSLYGTIFGAIVLVIANLLGFVQIDKGKVLNTLSNPTEIIYLCCVGIMATLGQLFQTGAYARERASVVSAFSYLSPVFAFIFGLIFFNHVPDLTEIGGGFVIIASSLGVIYVSRETLHQQ